MKAIYKNREINPNRKVNLTPLIDGLNARVSSILYNSCNTYTSLILTEWNDEHLEIEDSIKAQAYLDDSTKFLKNMSSGYKTCIVKELLDTTLRNWCFPTENSAQHFGRDKQFNNFKKVIEGMRKGIASKKVLEQVVSSENEFTESFKDSDSEIQTIKKKRVFSDSGAELDIDRVMSGDVNYWSSRAKAKSAKVIRLGFDIGLSHDNNDIQFAKVVGVGIALAKAIQRAGYSLEIYKVCKANTRKYEDVWRNKQENRVTNKTIDRKKVLDTRGFKICIKGAQELIDVGRLSNIGVVGVFRASAFRAMTIATGGYNGVPSSAWSEQDMTAYGLDCVISNRWIDGNQKLLVQNLIKKLGI